MNVNFGAGPEFADSTSRLPVEPESRAGSSNMRKTMSSPPLEGHAASLTSSFNIADRFSVVSGWPTPGNSPVSQSTVALVGLARRSSGSSELLKLPRPPARFSPTMMISIGAR